MKQKAIKGTTETNPSKSVSKKVNLNKVNLDKSAKEVTNNRVLIYAYPAEIASKDQRKKFRREARAAKARFEKSIEKLNGEKNDKEVKKVQKEMQEWSSKIYLSK